MNRRKNSVLSLLLFFFFGAGDCSLITRTGGLDIGKTDEAALINVYNSAKTIGVKTDVLSPEQVSSRFPLFKLPKVSDAGSEEPASLQVYRRPSQALVFFWRLRDQDYIGILSDEAGVIRPTKACAQIQSLARAKGAKVTQ